MPERKIPHGMYCYEIKYYDDKNHILRTKVCPYWSIDTTKPEQDNGYCSYLQMGDWDMSLGMLWDQVKECGINEDWEDE